MLLIAATGLAFFLRALAAFFLASLASKKPAPQDDNPVLIEETTGRTPTGKGSRPRGNDARLHQ